MPACPTSGTWYSPALGRDFSLWLWKTSVLLVWAPPGSRATGDGPALPPAHQVCPTPCWPLLPGSPNIVSLGTPHLLYPDSALEPPESHCGRHSSWKSWMSLIPNQDGLISHIVTTNSLPNSDCHFIKCITVSMHCAKLYTYSLLVLGTITHTGQMKKLRFKFNLKVRWLQGVLLTPAFLNVFPATSMITISSILSTWYLVCP
jgi:hypothetical protein